MVAPFVHHEQAIGRERLEPVGSGCVVAERLLDEHGDVVVERVLDHRGVRDDRRHDDDRVEAGHAPDVGDDGRGTSVRRSLPAGLGSRHDLDVAVEGSQVAQDVGAPLTAPDLPHDHGRRS